MQPRPERRPLTALEPLLQRAVAVGAVQPRAARIWLRSDVPGRHRLRVHADSGVRPIEQDVDVPLDPARDNIAVAHLEGLVPNTPYRFSVERPADDLQPRLVVGEGSFQTAPEGPADEPFAIAVTSCHQPFDDHGRVRPDAREALRASLVAMRERRTRLVLMVGDQMYADAPPTRSLFAPDYFGIVGPPGVRSVLDCSAADVRRLYQQRYRAFFAMPEWRALLAEYPCYPMLDDHELVDDWGADPEHDEARWAALREGALHAYEDYQGSRLREPRGTLPSSWHYEATWGDVAIFACDMRSQRSVTRGSILGHVQLAALRDFLARSPDAHSVLIVAPVPLFHISEIAVRLGSRLSDSTAFADRLLHPAYRAEVTTLCTLLRDHRRRQPHQRLVLVSGDIHVGAISVVRWDGGPPCHQLVASPVTNTGQPMVSMVSKAAMLAAHVDGPDATDACHPGLDFAAGGENPFNGLHVGFVEFTRSSDGARSVHLSLVAAGGDGPRTVVRTEI